MIIKKPTTTKKTTISRWRCQKCGRSTMSMNKPMLQRTGKCPKATNGNHSWLKQQ